MAVRKQKKIERIKQQRIKSWQDLDRVLKDMKPRSRYANGGYRCPGSNKP